jgi:hypothetical protein
MTDETPQDQEFDAVFLQLVTSLQIATMTDLGKIINPATSKAERNMERAQNTIDILAMLQRKTQGNLSKPEQDFIDHVLYELRMNFVDESERPSSAAESESKPESETKPDAESQPETAPEPEKTEDEEKPTES